MKMVGLDIRNGGGSKGKTFIGDDVVSCSKSLEGCPVMGGDVIVSDGGSRAGVSSKGGGVSLYPVAGLV